MRGLTILLMAGAGLSAQDRTISSETEMRLVAFSKDGNILYGVGGDRKIRQWDASSGALRNTIEWSAVDRLLDVSTGSGLFVKGTKEGLELSELQRGAIARKLDVVGRPVSRVTIANDRQTLAGSSRVPGNSREEVMRLWDAYGKERFATPSGIGGTSALAISPDHSILAAGSYDTNVRVWSTRNGELLRLIEELPVAMFCIVFTPDGRSLVTAGADRTVYFWDTKTWKLERKLTGQEEMIGALAISPDGRLLATGGFNDITQKHPVSILLWDVASGKVLRKLPSPHRVSSVAFSADGKLVAAASGDKTVRLWNVR